MTLLHHVALRRALVAMSAILGAALLIGGVGPVPRAQAAGEPSSGTGWSVRLAISNPVFEPSENAALTATYNQQLGYYGGPYKAYLYDVTANRIINTCTGRNTTDTTCFSGVGFFTGGPHTYRAYIAGGYTGTDGSTTDKIVFTDVQAVSGAVSAARKPWTIGLTLDKTVFSAGEGVMLTAAFNQQLGYTNGTFKAYLYDVTANQIVTSCNGFNITSRLCEGGIAFRTGGSHTYRAYIAAGFTGTPGSATDQVRFTDVQAVSGDVATARKRWTVALQQSSHLETRPAPYKNEPRYRIVELKATANQELRYANGNYSTYVVNVTKGYIVATCEGSLATTVCETSAAEPLTEPANSYVAIVSGRYGPNQPLRFDDIQATSNGFSADTGSGSTGDNGASTGETAGGNPSENCAQACAADPVNVVTGDFFLSATDLSLPGRGLPLTAARTYSASNAATAGRFGYGWADPFTTHLDIYVPPLATPGTTQEDPLCDDFTQTSAGGYVDCSGYQSARASTRAEQDTVTLTQETGSRLVFTRGVGGAYTAPTRVLATLTRNADGTYTFVRRGRTTLTFTAEGLLQSVRDANGNVTTLARDTAGRVSTVTSASGRSLTFAYDAGRVTSVTDSAGRVVAYSYDEAGNLTSVTDAAGAVTSYTYDAAHRMLSQTLPGGKKVTNTYDTQSRVTSQSETVSASATRTTTFSYSGTSTSDGSTTVTDASGSRRVVRYAKGAVSSQTDAAGTAAEATSTFTYTPAQTVASQTDALGRTTTFMDNTAGDVTSRTDPAGRTVSFTYNAAGDLTSTVDPAGAGTTTEYDTAGNPVRTVRPDGTATTATYSSDGSLLSTTGPLGDKTVFTYTSAGDLASKTTSLGYVTKYTYDAAGRMTTTTSPSGRVTTLSYDAASRPIKVTDPTGAATTTAYDSAGRATSTSDALGRVITATYALTGEQLTATDALGKTTSYGYDGAGRQTSVTDATGKTTTLTYDAAGRVITSKDPLGRVTTFGYDAAGQRTGIKLPSGATSTTAYNPDGTIASSTDALGKTTTYSYDNLGRAISVTDPLGRTSSQTYDQRGQLSGTQAADGTTQSWTYDAAGNQLTWTDAAGKTSTYACDTTGRRVSATVPGAGTTTYTWNNENELASVASAAGSGATYSYDKNGRTTKIDYTGTTPDVTFAYDKAGQRTSMVDGTGTTSYTYDKNGQPLTITTPAGKTTYTWTALGQQATLTYPDLRKVTNTYDAAGQLTKVSVPTGAAAGTSAPTGTTAVAAFGYTADGYLTSASGGNVSGSTTTMVAGDFTTFNAAGRITALSVNPTTAAGAKTGTASTGYGYTYDAARQLTAQTVTGGLDTARSYTFDARGQLNQLINTATTTGAGTATASQAGAFTANAAGDLTALPDGTALAYATSGASPATASGLLTTRTPRAGPVTSYAYDANGNRTSASTAAVTATDGTTTPARATSYAYDAADHLTKVTTGTAANAVQIGYSLNGDGQRVTRTRQPLTNGQASGTATSEKYVWDTTASVSTSGVPALLADGTFDYVYGPVATGTTTPIAQINRSTGAITWLHHDLTGSVTTLTSNTGTVTGRAAYSPYGTLEASTGTLARFGYAGEYTDPDTGLVHLRARDYDPTTAQFTTLDPAVFSTGRPYAYATGNPLQNADPLGLFSIGQAYNWAADGLYDGLTSDVGASLSNYFIGIGDGFTFGGTASLRESLSPGSSCYVDSGSFIYGYGRAVGTVAGVYDAGVAVAGAGRFLASRAAAQAASYGGWRAVLASDKGYINWWTHARQTGDLGERLVRSFYNIGPKTAVTVGNQRRVLDGLSKFAVSEVKNVKRQDLTAQLRDNIQYARDNKLPFDLYLRKGATIGGNLQKAIGSGEVNLKWIPFT